jgi:hypothetical protein
MYQREDRIWNDAGARPLKPELQSLVPAKPPRSRKVGLRPSQHPRLALCPLKHFQMLHRKYITPKHPKQCPHEYVYKAPAAENNDVARDC